ncbi:MAG TPA: AAA family ATPase, partial [Candidatus Babeliaceae bacterium]|nr:AAA family ATPase [Candidatus Babeliaceae bacterium]
TNFRQILFGQPSLTPEKSKRMIIILMTGAFAAALAVITIVLLLYFDVSVKSPSSFQKQTGIDILSSTNKIDLKKKDVMSIINDSSTSNKKTKRNRTNIFREHLRKLRQSLDSLNHPVILFTSTEHGQGKTTLMQALAYSMSLSKKKVLLIDTNFCNNDLTIQTSARPVLEKFSVIGELKTSDLESAITHTNTPYIDVIGCEGGDYTPQEILIAGNLLEHLDQLRKIYDFILLEAAPMNSYTDTHELIKYVDGVVSIFSAESVIKPLDINAIDYLKKLNGKFRGAILNKVELDNMES